MRALRTVFLVTPMLLVSPFSISQGTAQNAPSPEALQAAQELMSMTSTSVVTQVVSDMTAQVWPTIEAAIRIKNPQIDATTLATLRKDFEQVQVSAIVSGMKESAPSYARYFTAQELREIIAFYRTPVGAKAMIGMPLANSEIIKGIGPRMQMLSAMVNQRFALILQQRGYQP